MFKLLLSDVIFLHNIVNMVGFHYFTTLFH